MARTDALLRFLADQDQQRGVLLVQLPKALLDADLLTVLDGLVEFGQVEPGVTMLRGECVETKPKWNGRSPAAPGYAPLRTYLQEIVSAGWHVRLTQRGQVEAARLRLAQPDQGDGDKRTLPDEPKVYCTGWPEILDALRLKDDDETRGRVRRTNDEFDGPIVVVGSGSKPRVDKARLITWWNRLDDMYQELQQQERDRQATVADNYNYGSGGTVVPEIGAVKKRRRDAKR